MSCKLSIHLTCFLGSFIFLENIILCGGIGVAMFVLKLIEGMFWQVLKAVRLPIVAAIPLK